MKPEVYFLINPRGLWFAVMAAYFGGLSVAASFITGSGWSLFLGTIMGPLIWAHLSHWYVGSAQSVTLNAPSRD